MATFKISRDDIDNSFEMFYFSMIEKYHTIRIDDNGKQTCDTDVSGYEISSNKPNCPVPFTEIDQWMDAVEEYLNNHNMAVHNNETGNTVEFIIKSMDERGACEYEKKINGKTVNAGTGFFRDLKVQEEKDAWTEAVISFKNSNGIPTPTSRMNAMLDDISKSIQKMDDKLLGSLDPIAPLIVTAIPKLITDPCEFLSYLSQAGSLAIPLINGIPQPKEMMMYAIKKIMSQIPIDITNIADAESKTTESSFKLVSMNTKRSNDYFKELDAYCEEYRKKLDQDYALFETVVEPAYIYTPGVYSYENVGPVEYGKDQLPGTFATETVPIDPTDYNYKEVTLSKVYDRGSKYNPSEVNRQHMIDALRNFWIPLRKGWESYATSIGMSPTWTITCGYRPVGYKTTEGWTQKNNGSAHIVGYAIDVQPAGNHLGNTKILASFVYNFLKNNPQIKFDQVLVEFKGPYETAKSMWIHMAYKNQNERQRRAFYPSYRDDAPAGQHGKMFTI